MLHFLLSQHILFAIPNLPVGPPNTQMLFQIGMDLEMLMGCLVQPHSLPEP
jgi:hypothetical protein